ncbi:hypothetical protein [Dietzia sp. 179-F 9C3 NHS]|uniref:hypothetical protein n=1 Tax=Dietzia sp. 179-F 9C3 NHS TaxID=3374295 RepID=UPI003879DBAC
MTGSPADPIAVVGSPSDCTSVVLNLQRSAYGSPLLGSMVTLRNEYTDGSAELGLGTVTAVQTVNPDLAPTSPLASHIARGQSLERAGNDTDTRSVKVKVEAVFRDGGDGRWARYGSTLSTSPATGTPVRVLDQAMADELMADAHTPAYIGPLRGSDVLVPFTLPDFSGPQGSVHGCSLGATGSGKSNFHSYMLAADLRWTDKGHLVLDPQGQFASEFGLPFSLQGLAAACGRRVTVARLSQSLRLRKDAPLFLLLLAEAGWFRNLAFGAGADDQVAAARAALESALRDTAAVNAACQTGDWTLAAPDVLMRYLLGYLDDILPAGTIYAGREQQDRVRRTIRLRRTNSEGIPVGPDGEPIDPALLDKLPAGALDEDGERTFARLLAPFAALHSLWSPYSPSGAAKIAAGAREAELDPEDKRRDAWGLMREVMSPKPGEPAPWLILDLSADLSRIRVSSDGDGDDDAVGAALRLLDSDDVKARIIRQLLTTLELVGQQEFSRGTPLNVQVDIDEAHRWGGPVDPRSSSEARIALSNQLARMHREVRKFGIGFWSILQTATGLQDEIWKQITRLAVGYGLLDAAELARLGNRVPDSHLELYRSSPPPAATGRYPWMLVGGAITGLSFGSHPVFVEAFTDPDRWLAANQAWITDLRRQFSHLLPDGDTGGPLRSLPGRPGFDDAAMARHVAARQKADGRANADAVRSVAVGRGRAAGAAPAGSAPAGSAPSAWASSDFDDDPPPF